MFNIIKNNQFPKKFLSNAKIRKFFKNYKKYDLYSIDKISDKLTIEHIVPQKYYDKKLNTYHLDMHIISQCDSLLNSHRIDYKFFEFKNESDDLKYLTDKKNLNDNVIKNTKKRLFQPPPHSRGIIARSCAYFMLTYPEYNEYFNYIIDKELLIEWNEINPINDYEYNKNKDIYNIQQNSNPFINEKNNLLNDFINSIN